MHVWCLEGVGGAVLVPLRSGFLWGECVFALESWGHWLCGYGGPPVAASPPPCFFGWWCPSSVSVSLGIVFSIFAYSGLAGGILARVSVHVAGTDWIRRGWLQVF